MGDPGAMKTCRESCVRFHHSLRVAVSPPERSSRGGPPAPGGCGAGETDCGPNEVFLVCLHGKLLRPTCGRESLEGHLLRRDYGSPGGGASFLVRHARLRTSEIVRKELPFTYRTGINNVRSCQGGGF